MIIKLCRPVIMGPMHSATSVHHGYIILQHCRDLSGRGQDGWIRLQQAAADDKQQQAEQGRKPAEDKQVQLAWILPVQGAGTGPLC